MVGLFDMQLQLGGDPRDLPEFKALQGEMLKLGHPACPDLDWLRVEQLCMMLFDRNGAELQTAAFFVLARTQSHGLQGLVQGVALIKALIGQWPALWPANSETRLSLLAWLFSQLHTVLRGIRCEPWQTPMLVQLHAELETLARALIEHFGAPVVTLSMVCEQLSGQLDRLGRPVIALPIPVIEQPLQWLESPMPLVTVASRTSLPARRHWVWVTVACLVLAVGVGTARWFTPSHVEEVIPDAVQLDSLLLFDAGSDRLKPDATQVLIGALAGIKARPGWLIVIAGHTDSSGDPAQNRRLSLARGAAVRDWMQQMSNIAAHCFAVQGLAASQPVAGNDTEAGRAANRRVDIQLLPMAGACT